MGQPRPLFCLFSVFSNTHQYNFYHKSIWRMSWASSIRHQDSNSRLSDYESPPLTTRPGLPQLQSSLPTHNRLKPIYMGTLQVAVNSRWKVVVVVVLAKAVVRLWAIPYIIWAQVWMTQFCLIFVEKKLWRFLVGGGGGELLHNFMLQGNFLACFCLIEDAWEDNNSVSLSNFVQIQWNITHIFCP